VAARLDFRVIFSNPLINVAALCWLSAQLLKVFIDFLTNKKINMSRLHGAGGMPSSHSALVCGVALCAFTTYGYQSPVFALAMVLAVIVMYDATGVRWAAGLHARAINDLVDYLTDSEEFGKESLQEMIPELNESLGHRIIEVVCGALLGIVIALLHHLFRFI
jgi:acid phosphatase family membrane protein YuiD